MAQSQSPLETMLRLLNGHCIEQALHVVAVLGVADLLGHSSMNAEQISEATGADTQALGRVLRLLSAIDVFRQDDSGKFSVTELGHTLRGDVQDSVRDRAIFYGASEMWRVWGNLMHSVMTGGSAFARTHEDGFYDFLSRHSDIGAPFNRYMTKTSEQHIAALLAAYDFSPFSTLVDVGGGQGGTLAAILRATEGLNGILFDLPQVIASASALAAPEIHARARRVGGNMDETVPQSCDCYFMKWVLMDRSDEEVVRLLGRCREAVSDGGKIVVVEMLLEDGHPLIFEALLDIQMMLLSGRARLRSHEEFRTLFGRAGLEVARIVPTRSPNTIIEGQARQR